MSGCGTRGMVGCVLRGETWRFYHTSVKAGRDEASERKEEEDWGSESETVNDQEMCQEEAPPRV